MLKPQILVIVWVGQFGRKGLCDPFGMGPRGRGEQNRVPATDLWVNKGGDGSQGQ